MQLHHLIDHGQSYSEACELFNVPARYGSALVVPLLPLAERIQLREEIEAEEVIKAEAVKEKARDISRQWRNDLKALLREDPEALAVTGSTSPRSMRAVTRP